MFLNQIDNFNTKHFLWVTALGFNAAIEPKERHDPKLKGRVVKAKDIMDDDDDAEDGADGAGDEG